MKKIFKSFFRGTFVIVLLLLIQVGLFIFVDLFLDIFLAEIGLDNNIYILLIHFGLRLIEFIVALILFFKILTKMEDPEFKIAWLIGILLLPVFTMMMYWIFGNHGLKKKDRRIIEASAKANAPYIASKNNSEGVEKDLGRALSTFKYISNTANVPFHGFNKVTYYKTGEEFFPEMIKCLKLAKEFIFIEFFIISEGKLWNEVLEVLKQKVEEGVEVRVLYDDLGSSSTLRFRCHKKLEAMGIKCYRFHPIGFVLSGSYNNRDHRKIVVIDHQMAFTGGMNLADEYANIVKRFGYWKDTMVKIEGSAINNLITTFLQNYDIASKHVSNFSIYLKHDYKKYYEEGFVMPFGDGPGGIDDALIGEQNYINILNYAQKSCYISTPYLVPTYELLDTLRNAALRGVDVHLILPGIPDKKLVYNVAKTHFRYLLDAGVHIHIYKPGFNHMKSAVADDELAFVGTINFDFRSLVHHFECGTLLYKNPCIKEIREDFDQMLSVSEEVPTNFKLKKRIRFLCTLIKLFFPLL